MECDEIDGTTMCIGPAIVEPNVPPGPVAQSPAWGSGETCYPMENGGEMCVGPVEVSEMAPQHAAEPGWLDHVTQFFGGLF